MDGAMFTKRRRLGEFRPRRAAAVLVLASLLAASAAAAPDEAPAPARTMREIRVRVACDEEWCAQPGWERLALRRLEDASAVFEKRFAIRWAAADVVPWRSDDDAPTIQALFEQLERDVPRAGADVVLGFTLQQRPAGVGRDYRLAGFARFFGPAVLVRGVPGATAEWSVGSLVHELGHVLGAWHCATKDSVMWEWGDRTTNDAFDAQSAAVIDLCRDVDFARGADWLDDARRGRLREIFRAGHAANAPVSHVVVEMDRAWSAWSRTKDAAALRAAYRRALDEQRSCVAADDPSLVICLRALAWADVQGGDKNLPEAEYLARLAVALAETNGVVEDPLLQSEFVLAEVEWEMGWRGAATDDYRRVYRTRLGARGASDPSTVEVRSVLARRGGLSTSVRPWADATIAGDRSDPPAAESVFAAPGAGAVHVRPLPAKALAGAADWPELVCTQFAVATPGAGDLSIALRETGAASRGRGPHEMRTHVAAAAAGGETRVWLTFGTQGPEETPRSARYTCELAIVPPGAAAAETTGWFPCDAPWDDAVRLARAPASGPAGFFRASAGAPALLREWEWLGDPGPAAAVATAAEEPPDGAGAKCTWRLELTFTPDAAK
jgi:hypothetical protein